jgi:hypothetical protein
MSNAFSKLRKLGPAVVLAMMALALASMASGAGLTNGTFDNNPPFTGNNLTIPSNVGVWLGNNHWVSTSGGPTGSLYYAKHILTAPDQGTTDQLMQGFVVPSGQGTQCLNLSFDYLNVNTAGQNDPNVLRAQVLVYGFGSSGTRTWSVFAPWDVVGGTNLFNTTIDDTTFGFANTWTHKSYTLTPGTNYGALAIGLRQGFQGGADVGNDQGYDNVVLTNEVSGNVDIDPNTLNVDSKGKWITGYITGPFGCGLTVNGITSVKLTRWDGQPLNITGVNFAVVEGTLVVKFDRQALITALGSHTGLTTLTVAGLFSNATPFTAVDTINVIDP